VYRFLQDVIFSFRSLRRNCRFTCVAVFTLALGIAGNTAVFSVTNATLLRPLPYPEPNRLVILHWLSQGDISAAAFFMVKNHTHSFSFISALYPVDVGVNIAATGPPQYVKALSVSKDFFPTLGILPVMGNTFQDELDRPNTPRMAVLSYRLWTRLFDKDPSAIGGDLRVNGQTHRIIGIMPREFSFYPEADIWLPLQLSSSSADPGSDYMVIGRLADGISRQQAQHELDQLAREYPLTYLPSGPRGTLVVRGLQDFLVDSEREGLAILFAAVALVFLIACTNVAVLVLVRATANTQALAIRVAFGPGKGCLIRLLLTENLLLSVTGGLLGLILAKESFPLILSLWPADLPLSASLRVDGRVLLFTFAVSVLSPLLFGLAPALKLSRVNIVQALARTSRTASASTEQVRTLGLLVFGQMALCVMLLVGTMLLLKSLFNLYAVPLGFDPEHLVVAQVSLAGDRYRTTISSAHLVDQIVEQLRALPGVDSVSAVNGLPLESGLNLPIYPSDRPQVLDHAVEYRPVTPGYFSTLRIPLRTGRGFFASDNAGTAPVAIINETMAHRWWPGASAIGHFVNLSDELGSQFADAPRQIVGVVSDIHEKGPSLPPPPTIFVPTGQTPDNLTAFSNKVFLTSIAVRVFPRIDLSNQIRSAIQSVDPTLPVASLRLFSQVVDKSLATQRFVILLTAAFSSFALLLTAIGIHGLLGYQVRLRTREIAVRLALGGSRARVGRMVIQRLAKLVSFAFLVGLAGSLILRNLLGGLLYNVHGGDWTVVIVSTGLLLGLVATLVSLLTAIRAASIEPMAVLRDE
jgi:putative ABC transport system permease protein